MSLDSDDRAPSITNFVQALGDQTVREELREHYAVWNVGDPSEKDPEVLRLLKRMDLKEQAQRRLQFDELYRELEQLWSSFSASPKVESFLQIRNKLAAHTDVHYRDGKYVLLNIGTLGLKWKDIKEAVGTLQRLVELVNLLVRNASFAWEMLEEQLDEAVRGFWWAQK